ncbi:MAG: transporter substrate-binding domain-containing protein [Oscillospiraceae bacterium]|jgi:L-cystine transport system substrate-binding protein|nr:transporter substrate-binding domain-containing protein [Oscillospiraceae bacterium]
MKKQKIKRILSLLIVAVTVLAVLGGCAKKTDAPAAASTPTPAANTPAAGGDSAPEAPPEAPPVEVRKVIVATGISSVPLGYVDESGKLTGYDPTILRAIDELLPQYEFVYEPTEFAGILAGLDSKKYDIGAHYFGYNSVRAEKYLYGYEPYSTVAYRILTLADSDWAPASVADLEGKSVLVNNNSNIAVILEEYNTNVAKTPINLVYSEGTTEITLSSLADGRIDAYTGTERDADNNNAAYDIQVKYTGEPISATYTFYLFQYGDEQLRDDIDAVILKLREQGTLAEICVEWLGRDYTELLPSLEADRVARKEAEANK